MAFNYRKLLGRIVEKFGTQLKFAEAMGVSESMLSKKLNSSLGFKQSEICLACELLDIAPSEIPMYFFTAEAQPMER